MDFRPAKILVKCFFLVFLILCSWEVQGQIKKVEGPSGKRISFSELDEKIEELRKEIGMPGISIAIINNNEKVYHEVFGVVNTKTQEAVNRRHIFEAASLSKPIFAFFVMKLVEQGKIELDKPLMKYLPHPGFDSASQEEAKLITARMVLAHQTGMPNHSNGEPMNLAFTPGTDFSYSGEAYQYLAAIVGMQHGLGWKKGLNELFRSTVSLPLKMPHSTFVWDEYLQEHKVYGHDSEGKPTANKPQPGRWSGETFNAFSSLHSEAGEYSNFVLAMLKQEGLKPSSFEEMLKEQTHFKEDNSLKQEIGQTGWGLGFAQKVTEEYTVHMHTGNNHDFQAYVMFIPERNYGLVVFTNCDKMIPFLTGLSEILGPQF